VAALERFDFHARAHPVMGAPTMNVGTMTGGSGVNMVPDTAAIGVDIRTVPGMDHAALIARLRETLGDAELEIFSDLPPVWTPPQQEWIERVFDIVGSELGTAAEPRTATYMTDAANLLKVYKGAPTVVLGPGEPELAHQTDEWCSQERIRQAVALYEALIKDWCRL
jgi:succinyl-diaminopimelate desuccinylase